MKLNLNFFYKGLQEFFLSDSQNSNDKEEDL